MAGYRQGFIIGVLSLAGFVVGVIVGAVIAPGISRALAKSVPWQAFVAILVVFGMAVVGMLVASGLGVAVRSRLTGRPATVVDSLGGAAVNIVAVLVVAWLIGSFVVSAPFPAVARQVNNSAGAQTVDGVMPRGALYLPVFPQLRSLLSNGLYSQVFSAIGAESSLSLAAPNPGVLTSRALSSGRAEHCQDRGCRRVVLAADRGLGLRHLPRSTCLPTRTWSRASPTGLRFRRRPAVSRPCRAVRPAAGPGGAGRARPAGAGR